MQLSEQAVIDTVQTKMEELVAFAIKHEVNNIYLLGLIEVTKLSLFREIDNEADEEMPDEEMPDMIIGGRVVN